MISREAVIKLAEKCQTTELNIKREYYQHLFLSCFYQQSNSDRVFFKGGTALRVVYQSPRFSEDLDFSSSLSSIKTIEQMITTTLAELERLGLVVTIEEAKRTSGGYLAKVIFKDNSYPVSLRLEISLRERKTKGELVTIAGDFIPAYTIMQLVQEQLVDEKVRAFLSRKKPRDFYDLYFILRANLLLADRKNILKKALKVVNQSRINFKEELKQFLPKSHQAITRDFATVLKREIRKFI